jgi:hypothetical protein
MVMSFIIIISPVPSDKFGPGQCTQYSDSLQAGQSRDQFPVGIRIFTPFQTGPGAHPASYTMGTASFSVVKWPGSRVDHLPHLPPLMKK